MPSFRKILGWLLFSISSITFLLVFAVPFTSYSTAEKTGLAASLYLASQISWWLCLPLLGKEIIQWMKRLWGRIRGADTAPRQ